jgi:hypothetical protein
MLAQANQKLPCRPETIDLSNVIELPHAEMSAVFLAVIEIFEDLTAN